MMNDARRVIDYARACDDAVRIVMAYRNVINAMTEDFKFNSSSRADEWKMIAMRNYYSPLFTFENAFWIHANHPIPKKTAA